MASPSSLLLLYVDAFVEVIEPIYMVAFSLFSILCIVSLSLFSDSDCQICQAEARQIKMSTCGCVPLLVLHRATMVCYSGVQCSNLLVSPIFAYLHLPFHRFGPWAASV